MNYNNGTSWWNNKTTNVTVQQAPELTLTGGSVVPSTVDEGATVTHNASLTFENVSADGNTDTFQVIFPDSVRGNNLSANSAKVTNLSDDSDVSITSNVSQVDGPDGDGFDDTLEFAVSPDSSGTLDVEVNVSVDVTWPNVLTNTTETIRVAATDSSTGSVGPVDAADVTVVSLANFSVTSLTAPASAVSGNFFTVNATIENVGPEDGRDTVEYLFDGFRRDSRTVTLGAGNSTNVSFDYRAFASAGQYSHGVQTSDDNASANIEILTFTLSNVNVPSNVVEGENITVNATVTNDGNVEATTLVEFLFQTKDPQNQTVTLGGGNSTEVSFNVSTEGLLPTTYDAEFRTVTDSEFRRITVRETPNFLNFQGADASGFPTIRTFVSVNTTAGANGNLTESNFTVYEDGVEQSINAVNFTSNETQTDLDIVYVFDRSGSMSDEIDELRRQIKDVSNQLNDSGRDVRFGLVTFVDDFGRYDQNMTRNVTELENALDAISTSGSTERNYDAIDKALQLEFRGSAQKVLIDITDEDADRGNVNQTQAARAIQERGVNYVAISPDFGPTSSATDEDGSTVNPYAEEDDENGTGLDPATNHPGDQDKRILAERVGGQWFDIDTTNFTKAINDITGRLASTYIVEYDTTNTVRTGNPRIVNVTVDDPDQGVNSTVGQYIPPRVDIVDVDTSGFPTINATLDVNTTEGKAGNLGIDDFNISEDGSEQSIEDFRFDTQNETYVIEYTTPDPAENGTSREVSVRVSLASGGTIVVTERYRAPGTPVNLFPNVSFTVSPSNPSTGETVTFNASGSEDPDGTIVEYRWDLNGNGTYDVNTTSPTVNFSYSRAANINVELQVVDDGGATNSTSQVVSVQGSQTVSSGQPGFGIAVAVVALIAVVLFARRRQ